MSTPDEAQLVEYLTSAGDLIGVRVRITRGEQPIGAHPAEALGDVLGKVRSLTDDLVESITAARGVANLAEMKVSVGLEIGAKGRLILCEGSIEAHLGLELTFKPKGKAHEL